jgi:hypothetical protein
MFAPSTGSTANVRSIVAGYCAARSVEQVSGDLVDKWLAGREPADLVAGKLEGPDRRPRRVVGHMRADEDVGQSPERMMRRERLRIGDIEGGPNSTGLELLDEGGGLDRPAGSR